MSKFDLYVGDLLVAIERIENSTKNKSFKSFIKNLDLIDATGMRCQVIGESVKKIPKKLLNKYPEIKWRYLKEIRNILSHEYFRFDCDLLWDFIKNEIPPLKKAVKQIKKELK